MFLCFYVGVASPQSGTGSRYYNTGLQTFDFNGGFVPHTDPLATSFARRELSLPEWGLTTVASQVEHLLRYAQRSTTLHQIK